MKFINDIIRFNKYQSELVLKNCIYPDFNKRDFIKGDILIKNGKIADIGNCNGKSVLNMNEMYICPGFIDSHTHIESSFLNMVEYSKVIIPNGTLCVIEDPHEIMNVSGYKGFDYFLKISKSLPIDVFFTWPFVIEQIFFKLLLPRRKDINLFFPSQKIIGIGEFTLEDYNIFSEKLRESHFPLNIIPRLKICGHIPDLPNEMINKYLEVGISSDHETITIDEAKRKLSLGLHLMLTKINIIHQLSSIKNLDNISFANDDIDALSLQEGQGIKGKVLQAINSGLDSLDAIKLATLNPAKYFDLKTHGRIEKNCLADFFVFKNLEKMKIESIYKNGDLIYKNNTLKIKLYENKRNNNNIKNTIKVSEISKELLSFHLYKNDANVIVVNDKQKLNKKIIRMKIKTDDNNEFITDTKDDILKIAVIDRYCGKNNISLGLVQGFGLKEGAIASSFSHDEHNIVVVGVNDNDMICVIKDIVKFNGGLSIAKNGRILQTLPLPLGGLMSDFTAQKVCNLIKIMNEKTKELICNFDNPFSILTFLSLPVERSENSKTIFC